MLFVLVVVSVGFGFANAQLGTNSSIEERPDLVCKPPYVICIDNTTYTFCGVIVSPQRNTTFIHKTNYTCPEGYMCDNTTTQVCTVDWSATEPPVVCPTDPPTTEPPTTTTEPPTTITTTQAPITCDPPVCVEAGYHCGRPGFYYQCLAGWWWWDLYEFRCADCPEGAGCEAVC